jgi:hypothetical protein
VLGDPVGDIDGAGAPASKTGVGAVGTGGAIVGVGVVVTGSAGMPGRPSGSVAPPAPSPVGSGDVVVVEGDPDDSVLGLAVEPPAPPC